MILEKKSEEIKAWRPKLICGQKKLGAAIKEMHDSVGGGYLNKIDVPLIIRLVENPKYRTSKIFTGAVDLFAHDCIHVLLGRGVELKDEAFVIGYTMGSAKRMKRWRRNLFMFISKYFYPKGYNFGEEERFIFNMGAATGLCCEVDLSECSFSRLVNRPLRDIRQDFGIDTDLLASCYEVEEKCFECSSKML